MPNNIDSVERKRLKELRRYGVLDSPPEREFDELVELAARTCETPLAALSLVDRDRQWFKSVIGVTFRQLPRSEGFTSEIIHTKKPLIIKDTLLSDRFSGCPQVVGEPRIRFYAGIPLITPSGFVLGALAVLDKKPRTLSDIHLKTLQSIADLAMAKLEIRRRAQTLAKARHHLSLSHSSFPSITQQLGQVGIWEIELPQQAIVCSSEFRSLAGFAEGEEITLDRLLQCFNGGLHDLINKSNEIIAAGVPCGTLFEGEAELSKPDGTRLSVLASAEIQCDAANAIKRILGFCVDMSASQHVAAALEKSEMRFRQIANSMPHMIWVAEPDGTVTYANQAIKDYAGLASAGSITSTWVNFLHPDDVGPTLDRWMESIRTGDEFYAEYRLRRTAGQPYRWHASQAKPLRDADGSILKWYGFLVDIHDSKQVPKRTSPHASTQAPAQINQALQLFSRGILAAARANDEIQLLNELCGLILLIGNPRAVWIAYPAKDEEESVRIVAMAGEEAERIAGLNSSWTKDPAGDEGALSVALSTGEPVIMEASKTYLTAHHEPEARLGLDNTSFAFLPLRTDKETLGVITLCTRENVLIDTRELEILAELANSIACSIQGLREKEYVRHIERAIAEISSPDSAPTSRAFFEKLVIKMTDALGASAGFVARLFEDHPQHWRCRTLAAYKDGQMIDNIDYLVEGTPCERLLSEKMWVQADQLEQNFPRAAMALGDKACAYAGHRLDSSAGSPLGILFFLFREPLRQPEFIHAPLQILAGRTARDMEQHADFLNKIGILDKAADAIIVRDLKHKILFWNKGAQHLYGWSKEEVLGKAIQDCYFLDHGLLERATEQLLQDGQWTGEAPQITKSGNTIVVECRWSLVEDEDALNEYILAVNTNITERKAHENQIHQLAFYDDLTGLPNRRMLREQLMRAIEASDESNRIRTLLLIDLDHFKSVNDSSGHLAGDAVIKEAAQRIAGCIGSENAVFRLGGDEFAILLESRERDRKAVLAHVEEIYENLCRAFKQPFYPEKFTYHCTLSVGITLLNGEPNNPKEVLQQADMAMYQAKTAGRNTMRYFEPATKERLNMRASLVALLHEGIAEKQFVLFYQPQVHNDGTVTGAETLIRWPQKQYLTSPAEFIPLAEETGLIVQIGQWVLETACIQLVSWARRPETASLTLSVNVSARQFHNPDFVDQVRSVLVKTGAPPSKLKLELTESILITDIDDTIAKMDLLKKYGLTFALDDFGTGYSSLSYLRQLPFDQLKIDRSFITNMLVDPEDATIALAILNLGENLGLAVIAEGVETKEQHEFLKQHGCEDYQGYLFSPPLSEQDFHLYVSGNPI